MSHRQKVYNPGEREALLRGAASHWAGGAVRWMLHTGCSRRGVCQLTWADVAGLERDHPLYTELWERRRKAAETARATGVPLAKARVFTNYFGKPMNPTTLSDRLREILWRGQLLMGGDDAGTVHKGNNPGPY